MDKINKMDQIFLDSRVLRREARFRIECPKSQKTNFLAGSSVLGVNFITGKG